MSTKLYGVCTCHTGEPSQWGNEDVIGAVIDETGHSVGGHYSSSMDFLRGDLAFAAHRADPDAEYVWLGDDVASAPKPCPGCDECAEARA